MNRETLGPDPLLGPDDDEPEPLPYDDEHNDPCSLGEIPGLVRRP